MKTSRHSHTSRAMQFSYFRQLMPFCDNKSLSGHFPTKPFSRTQNMANPEGGKGVWWEYDLYSITSWECSQTDTHIERLQSSFIYQCMERESTLHNLAIYGAWFSAFFPGYFLNPAKMPVGQAVYAAQDRLQENLFVPSTYNLKGPGPLITTLYKKDTKTWDTCITVLIFPFLRDSKTAFSETICLM